jgi:oxygen-independent coproporphyrinogen-3 oxidase
MKGHILTEDDLVIRQHILNLMCLGHTDWKRDAPYCEALFEGFDRLHPLVEDGLVWLTPFEIKVTPAGKRFLRNVCMALDARLWAKKPESQLFSMAV